MIRWCPGKMCENKTHEKNKEKGWVGERASTSVHKENKIVQHEIMSHTNK